MNVVCKRCGWTHFAISRLSAEEAVDRFNRYYDALSPSKQQDFGRRASIKDYEKCNCGAPYTEMIPGCTAPEGCTIGPIIYEGIDDV